VIVDDDRMEGRNVNRILNSTMRDVRQERLKVDVLGDAVERTELGTEVIRVPKNLWSPDVIRAVAQCDVVFGCMDTVDGRYLLNALSTYYTIPYFDIGVRLDAVRDGAGSGPTAGWISDWYKFGEGPYIGWGFFFCREDANEWSEYQPPVPERHAAEGAYIEIEFPDPTKPPKRSEFGR
jgi:ThiF family protein